MRVGVIGTGYVGLVLGACLAENGNDICCADKDASKIAQLQHDSIPIYEPGLDAVVAHNVNAGRLRFTMELSEAVQDADVVFIAVGTPPLEDGSADLSHVLAVAEVIGQCLSRETVIVTKSTVPVGTAQLVEAAVARYARAPFHVVSNPEFMKEGAALEDFMRPDRVVIGADDDAARSVMAELYAPFVRTGKPIIFMDRVSAELTKYAANAMLATRISFMNEIALLCERTGADVDLVRRGMGADARIGSQFLFPGPGYGGSCFPKDVRALQRTARECGVMLQVVAAVESVNQAQKHRLYEKLVAVLGPLEGLRIAVWGLAFKAGTDDTRESSAIPLITKLLEAGAMVVAHDPAVSDTAAFALFPDLHGMEAQAYDALLGADALVIVTDWNEYRHPDFVRMATSMKQRVIIDGRNLYSARALARSGFTYRCIGGALPPVV